MSEKKSNLPGGFSPWLGVFETLRVEDGRAQFVEEHWKNLRVAAKALDLKVSGDFRKAGDEFAKRSGRLRWVVESGRSYTMFHPESLTVKPTFTLAMAPQRVCSHNWDARYKTLSYLTHWQARQSVRADEALLLNENGCIASGAMSNIFWVRFGQIFTPTLGAGCRNGVVRQWVQRTMTVEEGEFSPEDLAQADEIFLTNSWIGIRPVHRWEKRRLDLPPGPVTRNLLKRFVKV